MWVELTKADLKTIEKADKISVSKTDIKNRNLVRVEELLAIIEELVSNYEYLQEEYRDLEKRKEDDFNCECCESDYGW